MTDEEISQAAREIAEAANSDDPIGWVVCRRLDQE